MAELLPACKHGDLRRGSPACPTRPRSSSARPCPTAQLVELRATCAPKRSRRAADTPEAQRLAAALDKTARDLRLALPKEGAARHRGVGRAGARLRRGLTALAAALQSLVMCSRSSPSAAGARAMRGTGEAGTGLLDGWRDESRRPGAVDRSAGPLAQLNATPLSVAEISAGSSTQAASLIFTSATLAIAGDFGHYRKEMACRTR